MNKRRLALTMIVVLPVGLLAYWLRGCYMLLDIPPHVGDGEFQNVSRRDGPIVLNGYRVVLDKFDLSKDYEHQATLSRLPEIGVDCRLFFVIDDPDDRIELGEGQRSGTHGKVALELRDSRGKVTAIVKGYLARLIWSGTWNRQTGNRHALYPPSQPWPNIFEPDSNESYTLTISYKGDPKLAAMNGYASIECGGRK